MALNLCRMVRGISGTLVKRALHTTSVMKSDAPSRMAVPDDEELKLAEESDIIARRSNYPRLEFLEKLAGKMDPFDFGMYEFGKHGKDGSFSKPVPIPSMYTERLVACVCEDDVQSIQWMTICKGEKKQCGCGLWFEFINLKEPNVIDMMDQIEK